MTDAPAKVGTPQAAARWTFALSQRVGEEALEQYAKFKVYVYDNFTSPGRAFAAASKILDVAYFDVNRIVFKSNFEGRKLLIYNDSFTKGWQAYIDGQRTDLLRANGAFKGVWVSKGEHQVEFRYAPPGGQWVYVLTVIVMVCFLLGTIYAHKE